SIPQALAVYWDDLDADTGEVYFDTVGEPGARVFIVQWQDRPHYPGDNVMDGDEVTFQVQIPEASGYIEAQFIYQDVDFLDPALDEGASATIGYQDGPAGQHVQWSFNQSGSVSAGTVLTLMEVSGPCENPGDINADCHIDLEDFTEYWECHGGPAAPISGGCACFDMNSDGLVDLIDFALFQKGYTGPDNQIPGCEP
ncbi:MAG: hypothetical protein ABIG68_11090, partial [Acidobacteriota bacterium]